MHSDFYNISITHHTLPSFLTVRPCHFPAQGPPLLPPPTSHWWHKQGFAQHRPRPSGSPLVQLHVCARLDFPRVLEPPPRAQWVQTGRFQKPARPGRGVQSRGPLSPLNTLFCFGNYSYIRKTVTEDGHNFSIF